MWKETIQKPGSYRLSESVVQKKQLSLLPMPPVLVPKCRVFLVDESSSESWTCSSSQKKVTTTMLSSRNGGHVYTDGLTETPPAEPAAEKTRVNNKNISCCWWEAHVVLSGRGDCLWIRRPQTRRPTGGERRDGEDANALSWIETRCLGSINQCLFVSRAIGNNIPTPSHHQITLLCWLLSIFSALVMIFCLQHTLQSASSAQIVGKSMSKLRCTVIFSLFGYLFISSQATRVVFFYLL